MSVISGYPVGAKLTGEFFEHKLISKQDAQKILSFSSTSGPLFVIGSVGVGFFANQKIGIMLFLIHILSSLINGIIFGHINFKNAHKKNAIKSKFDQKELKITGIIKSQNNITHYSLDEVMYNSIKSVLMVGGFITIFYVFIQIILDKNLLFPLIQIFKFLGLSQIEAEGFCAGLFEITKGIQLITKTTNLRLAFTLSSFLISFSGLSILLQSVAFLNKTGTSKKVFFVQKLSHGLIALIIAHLFSFCL